jgi:DNA polymerase elongation subunit (family B)
VVSKKQARGEPCKIGARVSYVILDGTTSQYLRGEDSEYAREHKKKLDLMYYFTRQFVDVLQPFLAPYVSGLELGKLTLCLC